MVAALVVHLQNLPAHFEPVGVGECHIRKPSQRIAELAEHRVGFLVPDPHGIVGGELVRRPDMVAVIM